MPRASSLLDWADVRVGFPRDLVRVVTLMVFFCSIHSFLCNCGDCMEMLDRHLTSEGFNTLSIAKTSGKARRAPFIRIQSHSSISVHCYYSPYLQCHSTKTKNKKKKRPEYCDDYELLLLVLQSIFHFCVTATSCSFFLLLTLLLLSI